VLSLLEVRQQLDPLHPIFTAAHIGAAKRLRDVTEKFPEAMAALNATERANWLHGQIRSLVSAGVETVESARITAWDIDTVAVGVNLLVRFKYVGGGSPANVDTEQQRLLAKQSYKDVALEVLALAGITEPPTTVTCGYTLDGFDIGRVMIRRDCAGHDPWTYDIYGGAAVVEPLLLRGIEEARPARVSSSKKKETRIIDTGTDEG
jgi:hypothetical protein